MKENVGNIVTLVQITYQINIIGSIFSTEEDKSRDSSIFHTHW